MSKENKNCDKCLKELEFKKDCEIKAITLQATNCVQDIERKLKTKIADLEAKLAESERLVFTYQNIFRQKPETATEMYEFIQPYERELRKNELEIDQLKQQLAEKDKAIENWQTMYESVMQTCHNDKEEIDRLNKLLGEKCRLLKTNETILSGTKFIEDEINQDKVSFCIEQLEKVKELLWDSINDETPYGDVIGVREEIDNQINELKEKK